MLIKKKIKNLTAFTKTAFEIRKINSAHSQLLSKHIPLSQRSKQTELLLVPVPPQNQPVPVLFPAHPGFAGNQAHPGFAGNQAHPGFAGNQAHPGFAGKQAHPGFAGKQAYPGFAGKQAHPGFAGNQAHLGFARNLARPSGAGSTPPPGGVKAPRPSSAGNALTGPNQARPSEAGSTPPPGGVKAELFAPGGGTYQAELGTGKGRLGGGTYQASSLAPLGKGKGKGKGTNAWTNGKFTPGAKIERSRKFLDYELNTYHRSNQDTCLIDKPVVKEGDWIENGDLLADSASSVGGELSIGHNIIVAYMPWEGYNYEDAILINQRLVYEDIYTSIHIERYEIETKETKEGPEQITRELPDISSNSISHLDKYGIARIGSWVEEGDILVGKVTPFDIKKYSASEKFIFELFNKKLSNTKDSSLRAPKGIKAHVINVNILNRQKLDVSIAHPILSLKIAPPNILNFGQKRRRKSTSPSLLGPYQAHPGKAGNQAHPGFAFALSQARPGSAGKYTLPVPSGAWEEAGLGGGVTRKQSFLAPLGKGKEYVHNQAHPNFAFARTEYVHNQAELGKGKGTQGPVILGTETAKLGMQGKKGKPRTGSKGNQSSKTKRNPLKKAGKKVLRPSNVHVYLAEKRKIQVGDKMAGRHGNKGIVSRILPRQDMPFLPDGSPVDIVLNPLGVPSRMNVGQIYECLLGLAGRYLGEHYKIPPFDEIYGPDASRSFVFSKLYEARKKTGLEWLFDPNNPGKMRIFDGRTSDLLDQTVTVGIAYVLKLVHMVDDKMHMRSTGPYSLVTQQPLRGRSKQGGQRLGEMEVWAIEGYGAAFVLSEMLTIKSDNMAGRQTLWVNLINNKEISLGTPESFKVLVCELQALCLDIGLFRQNTAKLEIGIPSSFPASYLSLSCPPRGQKAPLGKEQGTELGTGKRTTSVTQVSPYPAGTGQKEKAGTQSTTIPNLIEIDSLLHLA